MVGIIGCGYVGLPLRYASAEARHKSRDSMLIPQSVDAHAGKSYIEHISSEQNSAVS